MLKYKEFVNSLLESTTPTLITEGGAYGHLQHPFDDMNLSFLDLENLLSLTVNGGFTPDNFLQTKCISGDSIVDLLENGPTKIKDVVNNKIFDKILSFNELDNIYEYADIINWSNNENTEEWLEIETEDGQIIQVTPNHRIFVNGIGDLKAEDLKEGMELIIKK